MNEILGFGRLLLALTLLIGAGLMFYQWSAPKMAPGDLAQAKADRMALIGRCMALAPELAPGLAPSPLQACFNCNALISPGRDGAPHGFGDPRTPEDRAREKVERAAARKAMGARDPALAAAFAARAKKPFDFQHTEDDFMIGQHAWSACRAEHPA